MSEIEKMYEKAGFVKKRCKDYSCGVCEQYNKCEKYPPFTAEKQIELIKWMIKTKHRYFMQDIIADDFSETLARVFNFYWQYLTEEERKQIKEILE